MKIWMAIFETTPTGKNSVLERWGRLTNLQYGK
jgi:hypothetical protein